MNARPILAAALVAALLSPVAAAAQSVPDDMRCLMLSQIFARTEKDTKKRTVAAQSMFFYLGRLDGRADANTLTNTIHTLAPTLTPATAGGQMTTCARHMGTTMQTMQGAFQKGAPHPAAAPKK
ncbi:MAG: hypothetical protein KGK11_09785 [Sphingomonadales bacterium]|nr:hypothetical protein [Sphingomonadales bacterium]